MYSIISQVLPALSGVAAGLLASRTDLPTAIGVAGGTLAMSATLGALAMPALRRHAGRHAQRIP